MQKDTTGNADYLRDAVYRDKAEKLIREALRALPYPPFDKKAKALLKETRKCRYFNL